METRLRIKQNELNKKYDANGLTPKILKEQIEINRLRHEHNIPDTTKTIYKEYVQ